MKKWCCPGLALMALLALFASALPADAWFCSMTGRAGDSTFVCAGMTQNCAHAQSECCYLVELPQSIAIVNTQISSAPFAIFSKSSTHAVNVDYSTWNIVLWIVRRKIMPGLPANASARGAPSFFHCAQHGPPPSPGRSPPVV